MWMMSKANSGSFEEEKKEKKLARLAISKLIVDL